jgi:hypothetical protein
MATKTTTDSSIATLRRELRETQSALDALDAREDVERALRRARAAQTSTAAMCDAMDVVRRRHARGVAPVRDSAPLAVDDDEDEDARTRTRARSDVPSADVETLDAVARACRAELSRDSAHSNVGMSVARRVRAAVGMARAVKTTEPYALFFEAYVAREGGSSRMDAIVDAFDGIQRTNLLRFGNGSFWGRDEEDAGFDSRDAEDFTNILSENRYSEKQSQGVVLDDLGWPELPEFDSLKVSTDDNAIAPRPAPVSELKTLSEMLGEDEFEDDDEQTLG